MARISSEKSGTSSKITHGTEGASGNSHKAGFDQSVKKRLGTKPLTRHHEDPKPTPTPTLSTPRAEVTDLHDRHLPQMTPTQGDAPKPYGSRDFNGDGQITREEFLQVRDEDKTFWAEHPEAKRVHDNVANFIFDQRDVNSDNVLDHKDNEKRTQKILEAVAGTINAPARIMTGDLAQPSLTKTIERLTDPNSQSRKAIDKLWEDAKNLIPGQSSK